MKFWQYSFLIKYSSIIAVLRGIFSVGKISDGLTFVNGRNSATIEILHSGVPTQDY